MKVETSKDSAEQVTITLVKTAKGGEGPLPPPLAHEAVLGQPVVHQASIIFWKAAR